MYKITKLWSNKLIFFLDVNWDLFSAYSLFDKIQLNLAKVSLIFTECVVKIVRLLSRKKKWRVKTRSEKLYKIFPFNLSPLSSPFSVSWNTRTSTHPRGSSFVTKIPRDLLPRWFALLPPRGGVQWKKKKRAMRSEVWVPTMCWCWCRRKRRRRREKLGRKGRIV